MVDDIGIPANDVHTATLITDWIASLLGQPGVSPSDNFLDLGGHSMLAIELDQQVTERFGVELDMRLLFEETIGETASDVVRRSADSK